MIGHDKPDKLDWLAAWLLSAATLVLLLATMDIGFTRDESFYFHAAHQYIGWFEDLADNFEAGKLAVSFTKENIDKHWSYNPEHPVLMKTLFALSYKVFHQKLEWMSLSTAMRLPGAVTASLLVGLVFIWTRQLAGRAAGLVAAACLLFQPRFFFHAHMACFDVPVTFFWFAVTYAYWRSYESTRWVVLTGLLWGLALSTKLNAFFMPFVLGGHWLWASARQFGRDGDGKWRRPRFPWVFVSMLGFGVLLFFGLWPRHWFDTVPRVEWYLNFHLKHVHYFVNYFGQNIQQPPFPISYPWVMTLVTVPISVLVATFIGVWAWLGENEVWAGLKRSFQTLRAGEWFQSEAKGPATGMLMVINAIFPIALISMPETPIFGGTKHWMPAMPFWAMLGGVGVLFAVRRLALVDGARQRLVYAVLALSVVVPAAVNTARVHPFGTSYYNETVGFVRGAADLRMMRQFWGYASRQALPWLNENAPQRATINTHNTTGFAWGTYRREKQVRGDLRPTSLEASQLTLFHHQKAFNYHLIDVWDLYRTRSPRYVVDLDGVPLLSVYERETRE